MDILKDRLLPYKMANLAKVIGVPALLKLVELRGGRQLYVPKRAHTDHWLAAHIGLESLQKLTDYCGESRIEIDRCTRLNAAIKAEKVVEEFHAGAIRGDLAQKYGMTSRNVSILVRKAAIKLKEES